MSTAYQKAVRLIIWSVLQTVNYQVENGGKLQQNLVDSRNLPNSATVVKSTNYDFLSPGQKIAISSLSTSALAALKIYLQLVYGPSEGSTVHFTDYKQDLRPAWGTVQKAAQTAPQGGFPIYFLISFIVLLRQLRRLYISNPIFQVLLVYNYSTCCTNCVLMRFNTLSIYLYIQYTHLFTHLVRS